MPPNQNQFPAPMPPANNGSGHDPYAFFMEPGRAPRRGLFSGGSGKKVMIIGGILIGIFLLVVLLASLSSGNNQKTGQLLSLAQSQAEVIRVATDGVKNADSGDLQNFAETTVVSVSSDQRLLLAEFAKSGKKFKPKDIALGKNVQTDQALAAAQAANTYDATFASTMDSDLAQYMSKLNVTAQTAGPSGQKLLKQEIDNATKLRNQLHAYSPVTPNQ